MGSLYRTCWANLILFLLCGSLLAEDIPPPPPSEDIGMAEQKYFQDIKENLHNTPITDTRPNGNRQGRYGDQVGWASGSTVELYVCDSSPDGTSWHKVDTNQPITTPTFPNQLINGWVTFDGTTNVGGFCTILDSYNVDSVTDNGGAGGDYTITWTTDFADGNYSISGIAQRSSMTGGNPIYIAVDDRAGNPAAGTVRITCFNAAGGLADAKYCSIMAIQ